MNKYLKNLNRIEFLITMDCTGKCRHCSEGDHIHSGIHIDKKYAKKAVEVISKEYSIESVMTFGGEAMLHYDCVCEILSASRDCKIPKRQLITNGYFSKDERIIDDAVKMLKDCGVNDILLSVDAFHQETIPLDIVKYFAIRMKEAKLPVRLNPAWLVHKSHNNQYNIRTAEILGEFLQIEIDEGCGNVVFPEGRAVENFGEYFDKDKTYSNPYAENPYDIRSVSIEPDGKLLDGNIYNQSVIEILDSYKVL